MSVLLVFSCIGVSVAASFPDIETDWAINEIEYMVSKGILNGYPEDGTFKPTRIVTRAEFIKMMCETFGLTATTAINYTDVKSGDWYYPYIQKAAAQGFLLNYGSALNPNGQLSRQEAAALLVRYLDLDPDNAAPSSTYPDYAKIKTAYREYVLQATAEGLFKGRDNGNFDPEATLQRREAAAILHRAVGTVYRSSQEGTDLTAAAGNAVITTSGVTVRDARVTDRMIITEGVSGGKIVLEDCEIGELIIRGTATVDLDGTDVDKIIVDSAVSGATTYITMGSALTVGEVLLKTPGRMEIASRTEIGKLTVEKDAKNSSATGYGTVNSLYVYANGFEADKVPTTYELSSGITAEFDDVKYSGSSASAANTGFTQLPSTYASASACFLTSTAVASGRLYYYYSFNATAPSKTTFDSFYEAAAVKGNYTVTKSAMDKNTGTTVTVAAYPYVVVMLRDNAENAYNPVVITNRSSSGFTVAPEVTTSNSYHYLAYTAGESGTLYYYYTNNSEVPTSSSFSSTYNSSSTSYKGTVDAAKSTAANSVLLPTSRVTNYAYIAVMLEDASYERYQPVLIPVKATAETLGNGFSSAPKCSLSADGISLTYTASSAGTLQYYLTTSNVEPTSAQFDTNLALTDAALTGAATVSAGSAASLTVGKGASASSYPYMVVRLTSGTKRYAPVVVSTSGVSVNLTGTGFNSIPKVTVVDGYYYLNLDTSYASKVYYYLTSNPIVSKPDVFLKNYETATSGFSANSNGGYVTTYGYNNLALRTDIKASAQNSYSYLTLMVSIGSQNHTPVVIPLPAFSAELIGSESMFLMGPSYICYGSNMHQIEFATTAPGSVFVYYTDDVDNLNAEEIIAQLSWLGGNADARWDSVDVMANTQAAISFNIDSETVEKYAAVIFVDANNTVYKPVILTTDGASSSLIGPNGGFSKTPTVNRSSATSAPVMQLTTSQSGTVYYYFTTATSAPSSAVAFINAYNSTGLASLRGEFSVGIGSSSQELTTLAPSANYSYVVVLYKSSGGGYGMPIALRINNGSGSGTSVFTTNAFSMTPTLNGSTLYFSPLYNGTLYYSFSNSDDAMEWLAPALRLQGIGSTGGNVTPSQLSQFLCYENGGSYTTVYAYGSQQTLNISLKDYTYLVVWMVTNNTVMTEPVFIPISGSSSGYPGNTGYYPNASGFYYGPTYNENYYSGGSVSFMATVQGYVEYFYTNSNTTLTGSEFEYQLNYLRSLNEEYTGIQFYSANENSSFSVNPTYGKYLQIRLVSYSSSSKDTYTPVCVQIS